MERGTIVPRSIRFVGEMWDLWEMRDCGRCGIVGDAGLWEMRDCGKMRDCGRCGIVGNARFVRNQGFARVSGFALQVLGGFCIYIIFCIFGTQNIQINTVVRANRLHFVTIDKNNYLVPI